MSWNTSYRTYEFDVPLDDRVRLFEAILATGDPSTPLSRVSLIGNPQINLFGMPGYIFPGRDIQYSGRITVKTGSMVANPMAVEFSYRFSGTKLQLLQVQTWGAIEIDDVVSAIEALLNMKNHASDNRVNSDQRKNS